MCVILCPKTRRVFSGETFSAYLNIANASTIQANNVKLQVRLTPTLAYSHV